MQIMRYRMYTIEFVPPPKGMRTGYYLFMHKDYDGSDPGDKRIGKAMCYADALKYIDEIESLVKSD